MRVKKSHNGIPDVVLLAIHGDERPTEDFRKGCKAVQKRRRHVSALRVGVGTVPVPQAENVARMKQSHKTVIQNLAVDLAVKLIAHRFRGSVDIAH